MSENQKNGICPMMSKSVIKPGMASDVINLPHGQAASVVETVILAVPCAGPGCQLWDGHDNMCSLKSFAGVQHAIDRAVERPRNEIDVRSGSNILSHGLGEEAQRLYLLLERIVRVLENREKTIKESGK